MTNRITLPAILQEGAILQRDCPLRVWGWAPPGCRVRVTLGTNAANSWCSEWGNFRVVLPAMEAGGPHALTVELPDHPDFPALEVDDIWIGEVWLASGQSNMQWKLGQCGSYAEEAVATANYPGIRMFHVKQRAELAPQQDVAGNWLAATPENAPDFSAVGYFFARRMHEELRVPVGVIVSAWGGTPIEAWMPRSAHATSELLSEKLRQYEANAYSDERWAAQSANGTPLYPPDPGMSEDTALWSGKDFLETAWLEMELPNTWQRHGHGHSGVFWFRRTVTIPDSWVGRELLLQPGAIDKHDITFVNGVEVGRTGTGFEQEHWNKPRWYRIPGHLVADSRLVIAVRVYSFAYEGGMLGPADKMRLSCADTQEGECLSLAGPWKYQVEHDLGVVATQNSPGHLAQNSPAILYENMIAPLAPFALRGALWYQGESNTSHAAEYAEHLRAMITAWRSAWGLSEFPFLIVQLPGFGVQAEFALESSWALLRQGQLELVQKLPGIGLAVTLDCGEADDIHPTNKQPVGERLARWALAETHGIGELRCGPMVRNAVLQPDASVLVDFKCVGEGLATADGEPVGGMFLLDGSEVAHPAKAEIEGTSLRVRAETCRNPVAVFYAWADFPLRANLINREGLPASPFRCAVNDSTFTDPKA